MGQYAENDRVATGPMRSNESYGTDRDKVRWAMLSSDRASPISHPDRNDDFVMTALVRKNSGKKNRKSRK